MNNKFISCPVCKSGVSVDELTPIYSGNNCKDPRENASKESSQRPNAQRSQPTPNENYRNPGRRSFWDSFTLNQNGGGGNFNFVFLGGLGVLPLLIGMVGPYLYNALQNNRNNQQQRRADPNERQRNRADNRPGNEVIDRMVFLMIVTFIYFSMFSSL
uniref:Uncharacterized protein n=1 Tax=Euplotes crassus TaxID=5936 RepID=A0A7S3P3D0_EUPCR|mmetsp:Transcript_8735/g.8282  ORF Transcript_8735/g.8282 Transcript_8735/m.8282 type:complete len:158 (+) Transcript_8735:195-668(+)